MPVTCSYDETLVRLIDMTNQTNLIALDKTLYAVRLAPWHGHKQAARYVASIAERICRASVEVGMTLPVEQRACSR